MGRYSRVEQWGQWAPYGEYPMSSLPCGRLATLWGHSAQHCRLRREISVSISGIIQITGKKLEFNKNKWINVQYNIWREKTGSFDWQADNGWRHSYEVNWTRVSHIMHETTMCKMAGIVKTVYKFSFLYFHFSSYSCSLHKLSSSQSMIIVHLTSQTNLYWGSAARL